MARGEGREVDDSALHTGQNMLLGNPQEWDTPQAAANLRASDIKIASDLGIPLNELGPAQISAYQQEEINRSSEGGGGTMGFIMDKVMPAVIMGAITAGVGSELAATAGAELGTGAVASNAIGYGAAGAATGAAKAYGTGQNIGKGALAGGASGALGGSLVPAAGAEISDVTGIGTLPADAIAGAGIGAAKSEITGQDPLLGAVGGGIGGAVQGSGLKQELTEDTGSAAAAGLLTSATTATLTSIAGSTLTSPTGKATPSGSTFSSGGGGQLDELPAGVAPTGAPPMAQTQQVNPTTPAVAPPDAGPAITSPGSSFLGDLGAGVASSLGGGSLGYNLGTLAPYAAVAAVGEAQAAKGQAQDKQYADQQRQLAQPALAESKSLQNQYDTGTLNPADKAVVDTGIAQGQDTIASANGLSAIAQQAFADYNSGTLRPGDQAALDAQTSAAKSAMRQQLASAGITDSTILAGQDQQIDQQALISKQQTLNGYFDTGNKAYNSWLTATQEGKAMITQAQTFASTQLQQYLNNSMAEAGIGMGEMNIAISTQMQTDAQYAAQMSTLLGTLATAYAKQMAGRAAAGGGTKIPGVSMPGSGAIKPPSSGGGGMSAPPGGDVSGGVDPTTGIPYDIEAPGVGQPPPMSTDPFDPGNTSFSLPDTGGDFNSVSDTYDLGGPP